MDNTSRQNRALVREILMSKTLEDRFLMCAEMYDDAKEFAQIAIPEHLTSKERELYIFKRIHGAVPEELI